MRVRSIETVTPRKTDTSSTKQSLDHEILVFVRWRLAKKPRRFSGDLLRVCRGKIVRYREAPPEQLLGCLCGFSLPSVACRAGYIRNDEEQQQC